jgi:hypothetical protein
MGEEITVLTSAFGHNLVKSFSGPDVFQQPFLICSMFNVAEKNSF